MLQILRSLACLINTTTTPPPRAPSSPFVLPPSLWVDFQPNPERDSICCHRSGIDKTAGSTATQRLHSKNNAVECGRDWRRWADRVLSHSADREGAGLRPRHEGSPEATRHPALCQSPRRCDVLAFLLKRFF